MAKRTTKKEVIDIIKKFLNLIQKNNIPFDQVYLYGSYAKGSPHEDRDIDLAIIAEE